MNSIATLFVSSKMTTLKSTHFDLTDYKVNGFLAPQLNLSEIDKHRDVRLERLDLEEGQFSQFCICTTKHKHY